MRRRFFLSSAHGIGEPVWQPVADVFRTRKGWVIKMELAGIRLEDIQLFTEGRCLTVQGLRRDFLSEECSNYYSLEISYNRFRRAIVLPDELDQAQITTEYRDGMLIIRIDLEVKDDPGHPAAARTAG